MLKISGLDSLSKELEEAQKALADLDGSLGSVSFDPSSPADIERAIKEVEMLVDKRAGRYADNAFVAPLIEGMKEQYRAGILERAAEARLKSKS